MYILISISQLLFIATVISIAENNVIAHGATASLKVLQIKFTVTITLISFIFILTLTLALTLTLTPTFVLLVMIGTKIEITKIMFFACYNSCPIYPMKMLEVMSGMRRNTVMHKY